MCWIYEKPRIVQDHIGTCTPPGPVAGTITNDEQQALKGAHVLLKNNLVPNAAPFNSSTNAQGNYAFAGAPGTCNYSIIPSLDTLPANGVNTLDVMLTDWHISSQQLLPTPYRIIAADANHDGQVNASDLDAMGDLIIGISSSFPNNTSWRFVPSSHIFPDPQDPLAAIFPEKISTTCPAPSGLNQHFVALKTGDVDASANLSNSLTGSADDRSIGDKTAMFRIVNQRFVAGDDVTATLIAPDMSTMLGFQFTLFANQEKLALQSAEPLLAARLAVYPDQNNVALSWYAKAGETSGIRPVITLHFKALQSGTLKQSLQFSSTVAQAEAYDLNQQTMDIGLEFSSSNIKVIQAKLLPVTPNPATGPVTAQFFIPENGNITLSLSDLYGGIISTQHAYFEAGWHQVEMPVGSTRVSGTYALRLQSDFGVASQRVMLQR